MALIDILQWGGLAALVTAAVMVYRMRPEVRSIDNDAWETLVDAQEKLQRQVLHLSAELLEEQRGSRALAKKIDLMQKDYEKRIEIYKSQIASLEMRIRELEFGKA